MSESLANMLNMKPTRAMKNLTAHSEQLVSQSPLNQISPNKRYLRSIYMLDLILSKLAPSAPCTCTNQR